MRATRPRHALAAAALALTLTACATGPDDTPQATLTVPAQFKEAAAAQAVPAAWKPAEPAEAQARGQWWRVFADPALDALQQQARQANGDVAAAAARLQAARALLRVSEADRMPQLHLDAGVSRGRQAPASLGLPAGTNTSPASLWQAGLGASYEVDLFQRVAQGVKAAEADAAASQAAYQSVLLAVQADVAHAYFQLRTLDAERALLDRTLGLRRESLDLTEKRYKAGDISEFDAVRARTELAVTQSEAEGLAGRRAQAEHALALLLGQSPAQFTLPPTPLAADAAVPTVPAGLPSALLERRPDVAAAQWRMMAARARVGLARSALFPALTLTASGGYASYELSDLLRWDARQWLVGALFSLPVLDGGRNRAQIERARAGLEEASAGYRQAVLGAFGEVEDRLSALSAVRGQVRALDDAVVSGRRAAELADKRYKAGEDSYLVLMDSQRNLLAIERQAIQLRGLWAASTIGLIRSIGGDWSATGETPAAGSSGSGDGAQAASTKADGASGIHRSRVIAAAPRQGALEAAQLR